MSVILFMPSKYGFSVWRWENVIDVMIEKSEGVREIHLMRIIGLVEADFNCALKILYSNRLMVNAETAGILPDQWGDRKNRDALTCATRGLLASESVRTMKKTIIACSADAAACFGRVRSAYALVLRMKKRMTESCCKCASPVVRKLCHSVKTNAGVFAKSYRQEDGDDELTGIPRGTAHIVAMHTMVSDTMLAPMKTLANKDANHFVITFADDSKTAHRTVDMYVDDATMCVGCSDHEDLFPCISDADDDDSMQQHIAQLHESSLETTARMAKAILRWTQLKYIVDQGPEFSKYGFQMLTWKNVDGSLEPATSEETPCAVTVKDQFGHSHKEIRRVEPDESLEGLGFLDGTWGPNSPAPQGNQ